MSLCHDRNWENHLGTDGRLIDWFRDWQITSRYDGVIKKLHYDAGEMAVVGKVWRYIAWDKRLLFIRLIWKLC